MTVQEAYSIVSVNKYWIESTGGKDVSDWKWLFYKPTDLLDGLYDVAYDYNGRHKKENGKFSIENIEGRTVIKLDDSEYYLTVKDNDTVMVWESKAGDIRVLRKLKQV